MKEILKIFDKYKIKSKFVEFKADKKKETKRIKLSMLLGNWCHSIMKNYTEFFTLGKDKLDCDEKKFLELLHLLYFILNENDIKFFDEKIEKIIEIILENLKDLISKKFITKSLSSYFHYLFLNLGENIKKLKKYEITLKEVNTENTENSFQFLKKNVEKIKKNEKNLKIILSVKEIKDLKFIEKKYNFSLKNKELFENEDEKENSFILLNNYMKKF
jgi:hypothetical protein